jgi:sialate O-acetylesterase
MWLDWDAEDAHSWAKIRLAQAKARDEMPGTGMICLLDQGEYGNIHPTAKRPVGERLAELAGAMLYGGGEVSPRATGIAVEGNTMTVILSAPVKTKDGKDPNLLEVAGEDGQFVPARAEIRGNRLILEAEGVSRPVRARYAWTDYSCQVNLFGENGLPLEPFSL